MFLRIICSVRQVRVKFYFIFMWLVMGCNPQVWSTPKSSSGLSAQCEAGAAEICSRLMQDANTSEEFRFYGRLACNRGDTSACEYQAHVLMLASLAPRDGEDRRYLALQSVKLYEIGCHHDDNKYSARRWILCALALKKLESPDFGQKDASRTGMRKIVETECQNKNESACIFLKTGELNRRGFESSPPRGAVHNSSQLVRVQLARLRGSLDIRPSSSTIRRMRRRGQTGVSAKVEFCVSRRGAIHSARLARSSGSPSYDRLLVEKIGKWRFEPILGKGRLSVACTSEQFDYALE